MTRPPWSIPLLALALIATAATAPSARANECGNVDTAGTCLDSKTLVFCVGGQVETMICPTGEICVVDDRFGGGSGCIATRYTDCGEITEVGECAGGERAVVWCDANRVKARTCDEGTGCAWVAAEGWYDCVPHRAQNSTEPTEPEAPDTDVLEPPIGDDDGGASDDGAGAADTTGGGPLPAVKQGGAGPRETVAGGGAGCAATGPANATALGLLAIYALGLRRHRRVHARARRLRPHQG